ncbi:Asp-tRNA(Asn)/Glu-tRNA(Gln) amidotransferase subunit GatB [Candidatus Woesebacteria bacterium]|nr:Asp-tRNA(Asn)/Glu-tRNA(Gln) amidotransferase subunit GatB [Candidatus Woesebacteria bacterium]
MTTTPIIGIEIHVELKTKSKMFCGCTNDPFHAPQPNIYTCPVCLGMPGALPVANKTAIDWTIKIGQALGCEIATFSKFDRKHYFYPDLPKGYQISQYDQPLCTNGLVTTEFGDVRITRVHLEEDTGKLIHQEVDGKKVSLIDFNRSSVPLVEIVSEPDIHSAEHAKAYAKKIAQMIRFLDVSTADMEKGSMRLEANISVQTEEEKAAGNYPPYKVEVKNLNSFRYIERAVTYELKRHQEIREKGELPKQETRGWNEIKNQTFSQRSKESAEDYRYFPDPDLPPLRFEADYIAAIKESLPKLPDQVQKDWLELGIKPSEASVMTSDPTLVHIVDAVIAKGKTSGLPFLKVLTQLVNKKITLDSAKVDSLNGLEDQDRLVEIEHLVESLFAQSTALEATDSVTDEELLGIIDAVFIDNPKAVADYKGGKVQVIGFLLGMCSKKAGKKLDVTRAKTIIEQRLQST